MDIFILRTNECLKFLKIHKFLISMGENQTVHLWDDSGYIH